MENDKTCEEELKTGIRFEMTCGIVLAIFATILAITDLGAGKYGDQELMVNNEKAAAYAWYNTKGVKQSLMEGEYGLLVALMESGTIDPAKAPTVSELLNDLDSDIKRYGKEKKEILLGSAAVGEENWAQDVDGVLGKIMGAKDWEKLGENLNAAGDVFNLSLLFLQICLVIGATSLLFQSRKPRWLFFMSCCILGLIGVIYSVQAYILAWNAG